MAVTGTTGADNITLSIAQANETVDLLAGTDKLTLPDATTNLLVSNTEKIIGGTGDDTVTLTNIPSGSNFNLGSGNDTLRYNATGFDLRSTTLTSVETLKAGSSSATTFTVDTTDLASGGSVYGSSSNDTLTVVGATVNLSSTTLSSVEVIRSTFSATATTFTVDQADLASGGSIIGTSKTDTLVAAGTQLDLSSTVLSSINTLKAGTASATTFTVDQSDLVNNGDVIGSSGSDSLSIRGTSLDLRSTDLSSIEIIKAGTSNNTTFTLDDDDRSIVDSIVGGSGIDKLIISDTDYDISNTTISNVEILQAGKSGSNTFLIDQSDLTANGSVLGSSSADTLRIAGTSLDLRSTTLSSIEVLRANSGTATTFIVDQADLLAGGTVRGNTGSDTLSAAGTSLILTSTTLSGIERISTVNTSGMTFTVDTSDLSNGGSVIGNSGDDTLSINSATFNLLSTTLSSVETLKAGSASATTFTVDTADLISGGSVIGSTGNDTLIINATTAVNLSSTTLSSVEILKAALNSATTFTLDQADLIAGGSVIGSNGTDTLLAAGTELDFTSTTLSNIEILKAGNVADSTFTADATDLKSGGSVLGSSGSDTLAIKSTAADLRSTTLSSIETIRAGSSSATTFTVDAADLANGGSVIGSASNDTLTLNTTAFNLASTALTSVEILKAGSASATTFTLDASDVAEGGSILGSSGTDTLLASTTALDLSSTSLSSVEVLKAGTASATTFTADAADLSSGGSVLGSSGTDTLVAGSATLDTTSTTLSSIEILKVGTNDATTLSVDAADLVNGGSVSGNAADDTLSIKSTAFDTSSATLSSIEILKAGSASATTFTVDATDLVANGSILGSSGNDTLSIKGTAFDTTGTTLSSVEILKAATAAATMFTVDQTDLSIGGSVIGSSGADTLMAGSTALDTTSTTLSSVEILRAGATDATTFTVDANDLISGGSVLGSSGADTLTVKSTAIDLTSTTLSGIEVLKAGSAANTTFTVDAADLASGGSVIGSSGNDTLSIKSTAFDLGNTTLTSVEVLKAGSASATTFTVDAEDLASGGSVLGSSGTDTLLADGTALNLASTSVSSVEILKAGTGGNTTFTIDSADLANGGSVFGSSGTDTLQVGATSLDTSNTTLSSIEVLQAANTNDTAFTITSGDLANGGSVLGNSGSDTLTVKSTTIDLTSTTLSGVETLKAGLAAATTFTVDAADLADGGFVIGSSGNDTLTLKDTAFDLTSTTLSSLEILKAGNASATTFTVDSTDLASGGSIIGSTGSDTLIANGTALDLSSSTLTSVETLKAGSASATTFTVDAADLVSGGSVVGSSGSDTLTVKGTALDLTSTTLSGVEILKAGSASATTFTVDAADLASDGSVIGSSGSDTLSIAGTSFDLGNTTLSSVEILKAGTASATTFNVDSEDLANGGSVIGSSGSDMLLADGTILDLSSTSLSSVEILKAGTAGNTTFIADTADLASGGSVLGNSGIDTLTVGATALNTTNTTLSSIEILKAGTGNDTVFTVTAGDLASGGSVLGNSGADTLAINGTALNLTSTTLSSIETLQAGTASATTFTVDAADLEAGAAVLGSTGADTLIATGTVLDLSDVTLSSVEILKAGNASATTFNVDAADLASGGSVIGSSGADTLEAAGAVLDTSSTTLTSVEVLQAGSTGDTTFKVAVNDLASGGSVIGNSGADTLSAAGTALDLSSTTVSSVEILKAAGTLSTTFTVDSADLAVIGAVQGNLGIDTLAINSTAFDLTGTTLSTVEVLKAGTAGNTTFTVDAADLANNGSVLGSSGTDTLIAGNTALNLSSTALSSVEILKAGVAGDTAFTVDSADLAAGGSVIGSSGSDTLVANGTALDTTSTTLSSIETLQAGNAAATTFSIDTTDLANGGSVLGSSGTDTLIAGGTSFDLTSTTLSSVEMLKAGNAAATTFKVDQADLAESGTVSGSSGTDTLLAGGTALDLSSITISSIEILKAGTASPTTITVNQTHLAANGTVAGSSGSDTLATSGTALDLRSTTLSSVETLEAATGNATTFTVDQADLASGGTVKGNVSTDTLAAGGTSLDLGSTTLSGVEVIKAAATGNTTFIVDQSDLASGGTLLGNSGTDTLIVKGTDVDLTGTSLSNVEILKAATGSATTFTINQDDLTNGGSIQGGAASDTLAIAGTSLDLGSTALSSIEILKAAATGDTSFSLDQADLAAGGSVLGNSGSDALIATATALNLGSTTLSSVEVLKAGLSNSTTFTVDSADLVSGGSVLGDAGIDTLAANGTSVDLTATTLSSVEVLKAGSASATTFKIDQADLSNGGSVTGNSGTDTLLAGTTALNLSSTSLNSVEILKVGTTDGTTLTVDTADLAAGGSVLGSSGTDTLATGSSALDLGSVTLSSVEILQAGTDDDTTITVDQADLAAAGSVLGGQGSDTLIVKGSSYDLSSTTLSSVDTLQAGSAAGTTFKLDSADLSGVAVTGGAGKDTLLAAGTALDLGDTTLSSIEVLKAGNSNATTFTIDQGDLGANGSVQGSSGADTLLAKGPGLDLGGTTLSSVEILKAAATDGATFTVDQADLAAGGSVIGNSGTDTLEAIGTALDLSSTTLTSVEVLQAGPDSATTFTVNAGDLASGGAVLGGVNTDTLVFNGTAADLSNTTLSGVEVLKAGTSSATTFTVNQTDLSNDPAFDGEIRGSSGTDTLLVAGTEIDLRSTTLSSIETIKAGTNSDTKFTVDQADLVSGGKIVGGGGNDTLILNATSLDLKGATLVSIENVQLGATSDSLFLLSASDLKSGTTLIAGSGNDTAQFNGTAFNLTSLTLSSIEILRAGASTATTFTIDQADLASGGVVRGSTGSDTLAIKGALLDLTSTALNSVENLKAGLGTATTFRVDQADLLSGGFVRGGGGKDTLSISGTSLDLRSSTLASIETINAGTTSATTFTVDQTDLNGRTVTGNSGADTLIVKGTSADLTKVTLSSVEVLKASTSTGSTFTVDQADLVANGTVLGGVGIDTLAAKGSLDLRSTTLDSVEMIKVVNGVATFILDQSDLLSGGTVQGAAGLDSIVINGTSLDLTSTTLVAVENLKAGVSSATTFIVNPADLLSGGSVRGSSGIDTLIVKNAAFDLGNTSAVNVEILQAGSSNDTVFTVNQADLFKGGSVAGSSGSDTLAIKGASLDLTSTTLTSVESLKAGQSTATTFTVDQVDLQPGGLVLGSSGNDTLSLKGTQLDLTSTTLSSVDVLKIVSTADATFIVDQGDLASGGTVLGGSKSDTLVIAGTSLNLSSTALNSVETIKAGTTHDTLFTVDQKDFVNNSAVTGNSGSDTLTVNGTSFDLTGTLLSSVETLKAGSSGSTTFLLNQTDLASNGTVLGSSGTDSLAAGDNALDLTSTTLSSVEIIKAGSNGSTTFNVDAADLMNGGSVLGAAGTDTLIIDGTAFNLTSTTISSIEVLKAANGGATTFTADQSDLSTVRNVTGSASANDTLVVTGTAFDLNSVALSSVEILKAGSLLATTFKVQQVDLAAGGTVLGSSGADTLSILGTSLDLRSSTLSSIETLKAGLSTATTFTVDASDLGPASAVVGSTAADTLIIGGTEFDTTSMTLSSVEILKASTNSATAFTVDQSDLGANGSVLGGAGTDTLMVKGTTFNLSGTALSSIEVLKAGASNATTFSLDQIDLAKNGTVAGSSGDDTLVAATTTLDLRSTALDSVEILRVGSSVATTLTVNQDDLEAGGSVLGNSGADTLAADGGALDLRSTTLSSVEILKSVFSGVSGTTFSLDQADLLSGGTVQGGSGKDTLAMSGTQVDLTSTTLSSVEILDSTATSSTNFRIDQSDLAKGGTVQGSADADTLTIAGTLLDLGNTTLSSIEIIRAGTNTATTFRVDQADLSSAGGSVIGSTASDTLVAAGSALDLRSTTLSSIETIRAGTATATTFTADLADVTARAVAGSSGADTLTIAGTAFDLTSTSLSSVEILKTASSATTFTVDQSDLLAGGSIVGSSGSDALVTTGTQLNLASTTLASVETLKAGSTADTIFTLHQAHLASGSTITGNSGTDTLLIQSTSLDLSSTGLSSVEIIKAGLSAATTITLGNDDLSSNGSVIGGSANDTLIVRGTELDLGATTLSSIEIIKVGTSSPTLLTVDLADLVSGGSVIGGTGKDTLVINGTSFDASNTTLTGIDRLQAASSMATSFLVNQADLALAGSVVGSSGNDTLTIIGIDANLASTTLTSVEILRTGASSSTLFTVDQGDLAASGSVIGSSGVDTLASVGPSLDLRSTTLSSVEIIKAASGSATTFTVDQVDLLAGGQVVGNAGNDTLIVDGTSTNLMGTTLTSVETLKAGSSAATTFAVAQSHLAGKGSILGNAGNDTLVISGSALNLGSTALSSVEILKAGTNNATSISVDQADLLSKGSVIGGSDIDSLAALGPALDLRSTTLTGIEILRVGATTATTFTVDQADLISGGSVIGSSAADTLAAGSGALDLTSTVLSSIEILRAGSSGATTFTIDQSDLASNGSVIGSTGTDTLVISATSLNLTATKLSSIEMLKAGNAGATEFSVDQDDLVSGGQVLGSSGTDTLIIKGASFDLRSTSLSSIDILKASTSAATTFTVDQGDLAAGGSIFGSSGKDILVAANTVLDLTSTALTSIEIIKAGLGSATTFRLDLQDLAPAGSILGSNGSDTLSIQGTSFDTTSTTLSSIEILRASSGIATTFRIDLADLTAKSTILGSTGVDTLIITGTTFNLSSTTLSSVEVLQAGSNDPTQFMIDQTDLVSGGSVIGGTAVDMLISRGSTLDLSSSSLTGVEILKAGLATTTSFILNTADLSAGGSVIGSAAISDILMFKSTDADLSETTLSGIEVLRAGISTATVFTVDQADLASNGSVIGSSGSDTLVIDGTLLDLGSTTVTSIEKLQAGTGSDTKFRLDQADLFAGGSVLGGAGNDTLEARNAALDLRSTTLSSIEILSAGASSNTTFLVDQSDLTGIGTVSGGAGNDTLRVFGSQIDLTSTTFSSVEFLINGAVTGTTFILDDIAAGLSIAGAAPASGADTFKFVAGYGLNDLTDDNSIFADTATITNFSIAGTEIIDISALTANGSAAFQSQAATQDAVNAVDPTIFKDALDAAAAAIDGSANSVVTAFQYGGATYVLVDNSSGPGVTTDDVVIKLSGLMTLTSSEFSL